MSIIQYKPFPINTIEFRLDRQLNIKYTQIKKRMYVGYVCAAIWGLAILPIVWSIKFVRLPNFVDDFRKDCVDTISNENIARIDTKPNRTCTIDCGMFIRPDYVLIISFGWTLPMILVMGAFYQIVNQVASFIFVSCAANLRSQSRTSTTYGAEALALSHSAEQLNTVQRSTVHGVVCRKTRI